MDVPLEDVLRSEGSLTNDRPKSATRKRRAAARTALACTSCRRRKAKCSGDWPACRACVSRNATCSYPGHQYPATLSKHASDVLESTSKDSALPADDIRRAVISHFRTNYASSLLCFIPPQQLIDDDVGKELPLALFLSIIALVSRSIPDLASGDESFSIRSERFAERARRELGNVYGEPSLVTIQCCLVLCVYEVGDGCEHRAWLRLGHAARLCQLLLLHQQDSNLGLMNWGSQAAPVSVTAAECQRRTFWCCFCLERLLANGRDRVATFSIQDITTTYPQTEENFIYGWHTPTRTLTQSDVDITQDHHGNDSLFAYTIQIVEIMSRVVAWNGRGGRHIDPRCPWLPTMPFTILDVALRDWNTSLPKFLKYTPQNAAAVTAMGNGRLWAIMWMIYFQAKTYLYREYVPFTPKPEYQPINGPCDGPALQPTTTAAPEEFWYHSAVQMIESANAITDLYHFMWTRDLGADAFPFHGLGLLTAATIHTLYSLFDWKGLEQSITKATAREYLRKDMEAFNQMGQRWSLAIHWISLYYKLNVLTARSWRSQSEINVASMNIKDIKDGIMNYLRQISPKDRAARDANLKSTFDFEGWVTALEISMGNDENDGSGGQDLTPSASEDAQGQGRYYTDESIDSSYGFFSLDGLASFQSEEREGGMMLEPWGNWLYDDY